MARFACAIWRPISNNIGGALNPSNGLILHHAVMNGSGWGWFNNPAARASAHFWVLQDGRIEQYVDTSRVAWHAGSAGNRYVGVETEGCSRAPHADPMSEAMVNALARLYREGHERHGWPYQLANANGQRGFGFHRMFMATQCPCDVRLGRRQEILNRARGGAPAPPPPTPSKGDLTVAEVDRIMARLDRLEEAVRNTSGTAAVRGSNNVVWLVSGAGRIAIHPPQNSSVNARGVLDIATVLGLINRGTMAAPTINDDFISTFPQIR